MGCIRGAVPKSGLSGSLALQLGTRCVGKRLFPARRAQPYGAAAIFLTEKWQRFHDFVRIKWDSSHFGLQCH